MNRFAQFRDASSHAGRPEVDPHVVLEPLVLSTSLHLSGDFCVAINTV